MTSRFSACMQGSMIDGSSMIEGSSMVQGSSTCDKGQWWHQHQQQCQHHSQPHCTAVPLYRMQYAVSTSSRPSPAATSRTGDELTSIPQRPRHVTRSSATPRGRQPRATRALLAAWVMGQGSWAARAEEQRGLASLAEAAMRPHMYSSVLSHRQACACSALGC